MEDRCAEETARRANTVTIKFVNIFFAPPDSLVQHLSGAQLYELRMAIRGDDPRPLFIAAPTQPKETTSTEHGEDAPRPVVGVAAVVPASAPIEVAKPRASLPAMKFMSPFKPEEDPGELIRGLPIEKLPKFRSPVPA